MSVGTEPSPGRGDRMNGDFRSIDVWPMYHFVERLHKQAVKSFTLQKVAPPGHFQLSLV